MKFIILKKKEAIMIKKAFYNFLLIATLPIIISCNTNNPKEQDNKDNITNSETIENETNTNYRIPSPLDMFMLLKNVNKTFISEVINNTDNQSNYSSTLSKALNFGIYSSDLAYCSVFGSFQESLNYFKTLKQIAYDLGLYEGFGKDMATRIDNNLNNVDSLIEISADSYAKSTSFLSNQGSSDLMAMMMTGCWIESIYITIKSIENFNDEPELTERIADQQLLLDNLIDLINKNKENSSINFDEILNQLLDLQEEYDRLYENTDGTLITKNQYVNIANKIQVIRNNFIKTI